MEERKAYYTKSLGRKVATGALPKKITKIHVISSLYDKWSVVVEGSSKAIRSSLNKRQALQLARKTASNKFAETIVIHDRMGQVQKRLKVIQ